MDDTRTSIAPVAAFMIKGKTIIMVTSLETDTNSIIQITNLLNKYNIYAADKESDSQTLRNDEIFKSILKDAVK